MFISVNRTSADAQLEMGTLHVSEGIKRWRAQDARRPMIILALLARHEGGDWHELTPPQRAANTAALHDGEAVTSTYTVEGMRIQVTTEADRSTTTIAFPRTD